MELNHREFDLTKIEFYDLLTFEGYKEFEDIDNSIIKTEFQSFLQIKKGEFTNDELKILKLVEYPTRLIDSLKEDTDVVSLLLCFYKVLESYNNNNSISSMLLSVLLKVCKVKSNFFNLLLEVKNTYNKSNILDILEEMGLGKYYCYPCKFACVKICSLFYCKTVKYGSKPSLDFLEKVSNALTLEKNIDLLFSIFGLKILLRSPVLLSRFVKKNNIKILIELIDLDRHENTQTLYYAYHCIWLISFHADYVGFLKKHNFLDVLIEHLNSIPSEKVLRIIINIIENLMHKENFDKTLINIGIIKVLKKLLGINLKDTDLIKQIETTSNTLKHKKKTMSSFECFVFQVENGVLINDRTHTEEFWEENHYKLNENNFYYLRKLLELLDSDDETTIAITLNDIAEYSKFNKQATSLLEEMDIKNRVLRLMDESDSIQIRKNALKATQNLVINNITEFAFLF